MGEIPNEPEIDMDTLILGLLETTIKFGASLWQILQDLEDKKKDAQAITPQPAA